MHDASLSGVDPRDSVSGMLIRPSAVVIHLTTEGSTLQGKRTDAAARHHGAKMRCTRPALLLSWMLANPCSG
jgi:hypothetical protein